MENAPHEKRQIPAMIIDVDDLRIISNVVYRKVREAFPITAPHFFICWEKVVTLVREAPYTVTFREERHMRFLEVLSLLIESEFLDQQIFDRVKFMAILSQAFPFRRGLYTSTVQA